MTLTRFSSAQFSAADRLAVFMDTYAAIEAVDVTLPPETPPQYDLAMRALPGMTVLDARCSSGQSRRTRAQARDGKDDLVLTVITRGEVLFAPDDGTAMALAPGEGYLGFNDRPCRHVLRAPGFLDIAIERDRLAPMLRDPDSTARLKLRRSPELALLTGYARLLTREVGDDLPPALAARCAAHLTDLAVAVLGGHPEATRRAEERGLRAARLAAIKADIAANVAHPGFSLDWLAQRHRLRPRQIQNLFYAEGSGFADHVLNARLDLALAALRDPKDTGRNIAEIALSCGFSDLSWFNRTFRRRFAMTPREARAEAARAQSASEQPDPKR